MIIEPCPYCKHLPNTIRNAPGSSQSFVACVCGATGPSLPSDFRTSGVPFAENAITEWNIWARARSATR